MRTMLSQSPFRRRDQQRHADVFLVEIECVAVIALVLTERFTMVAEDDPDGLRSEPALLHALYQRAEGRVSFAQRVAIAAELVVLVEWSRLRRFIRMVAGDRQIGEKEWPAAALRVDPPEHAPDRRWLVDAEARVSVPADIASVRQRVVAALTDDGF